MSDEGMEGASVGVDMAGVEEAIKQIVARGKNTRYVMKSISLLLVEEVDDMFETSGHGKWDGYADSTLRRRGHIDNAKMLIDTGRLAASITPASSAETAEAFTNVEYAKYHVSDAPRTKIPLRDFFDIDTGAIVEEAVELILKEVSS